jgi:hypothetical protein
MHSIRSLAYDVVICLLLDDNEELVSFGYEAENKYSDIVIDRKKNEYLFFQRFKMQLYKNKVNNLFNHPEYVVPKSIAATNK